CRLAAISSPLPGREPPGRPGPPISEVYFPNNRFDLFMWFRLGASILLTGVGAWAQTSESPDIVGPPVSLKQELVGPPSPFEALPIEPEPRFPLPNIPLLDQE